MDEDILNIFNSNLEKTETCWLWRGATDKSSYPIIRRLGKEYSCRRLTMGDAIDSRAQVFVTCGNQLCLNPNHLRVGDTARFWSKVDKTEDCWLWTASKDKDEYGKFKLFRDGKKIDIRAHVFAYQEAHGTITNDILCVCHSCDTPSCVRIDHLFLGTSQDNTKDRNEKGRQARGEKVTATNKLTEKEVAEIRELAAHMSVKQLSDLYQVTCSHIRDIIARRDWKHVP